MNQVISGSGNGLLPVKCFSNKYEPMRRKNNIKKKKMICTDDDMLSIGPLIHCNWTLRNKVQWNFNENASVLFQAKAVENAVCKMGTRLEKVKENNLICSILDISMTQCKTAVTPLLMHWSYCSLALSHWYIPYKAQTCIANIISMG